MEGSMKIGLEKRADGATLRTATFIWDLLWTPTDLLIWLRAPMEALPGVWNMFAGEPYRTISLATWPELGIRTLEAWTYIDWLEFMESVITPRWWEPLPRDIDDIFGDHAAGDLSWL